MSTSISRDESIEVVISSEGGDILPPAAPLDKGKERAKEYIKPSPSPSIPISIMSRPSSSQSLLPPTKEKEKVIIDKDLLPHPAEDLSADDDLLSWILVDQLGCMPNTKLGVHPQQVKFVGPTFKTDEVLNIVKETVTKGNLQGAMQKLQEFHLIKSHLESKMTENQRERFVSHLRRYLLPLSPNSRLEIHLTSRYSFMTGHTELAIFATRPLSPGLVMHELQGSVVPLPDQWREEMEIGEDFAVAVEAAGEETDSDAGEGSDEEDDDVSLHSSVTNAKRDKGKSKEVDSNTRKGQRRSDRTKRRDFSIVWSGLKRCYQLFLGPARFLNHDCNPNVELLRQGKYVTFRVLKPIRVGDELTTFYGENYFGRNNIECLCLTCEQQCKGGFTPVSTVVSGRNSRSNSRDSSAGPSRRGTSADMRESVVREMKNLGPSSLRNVVNGLKPDDSEDDRSIATVGPSQIDGDGEETGSTVPSKDEDGSESIGATPTKKKLLKITLPPSPMNESVASEPDSPIDPHPRRERVIRKVVQNMKPWSFLQRPKKHQKVDPSENDEESTEITDDLPSDFPRCATCAKPLTEQIWFNGRYFEHCARCVRHAFIFELPWPSHRPQDVREYPPQHLIPNGFIPRKISTIPLPTLSKQPKYVKPIETVEIETAATETKAMRQARRLRDQIAAEEFFIESLREAAWSAQEAKEAAAEAREAALKAQKEAKEEERRLRVEEKKKRDAKNIKGSGVWSRYAYLTEEEIKKKEAEKNQVLSGTRRGGRFRAREDEEEMKKLAEERARKEQREKLEQMGIDPSSPVETTDQRNGNEQDGNQPAEEEEEEEEGDVSVVSSSGTSTELIVDPRSLVKHHKKTPIVLIPRTRTEDEDDEMEVATSPVLSVLPPSKLPKSRISLPSSSPSTSISKPRLSLTSTSASTTKLPSTSTTFRPIAPKIVSTNHSSTSISPANRKFYPGLPFKATPSPKRAPTGATSGSSSTKRTPIIDLTLESDESDNDEGNNSNASGQESTVKRKKGRPLGSGKHQKAAMKKLAKSQSQLQNGNLSNGRISPIDLTLENEGDWKGKGKAKAQVNHSPNIQTIKASKHVMTSGIELPDSSSSTNPAAKRDGDRVAYSRSNPSTHIEEGYAGPDKYTIVRTPIMTRFIAPPFDFVQYHKPKPTASGSGSNSTSSLDVTENTLDNPASKDKQPAVSTSSSSPIAPGGSSSSGEKKTPRLILNVNTSPTVGAKKGGSGSGFVENRGKGKEKMVYPLSSEANREKSHQESLIKPSSSSTPGGTKVVKDVKYSNGSKDVEGLKPLSTSSTSTPNGATNVNEKKRKRISDVSEASSSSSPSNQPEKKKRTFFPSMMSVSVVKPSMPSPKPRHSISK
ncbi:hypothetical protein I302_104262 [Kwoniella bestiolae CBS 10118]|uniref:SET domain-containing protein n=1 Tax=Kwoniella bestiolae CBS 10118 TaxID=1296100 RepID=A0A1B9GAT4_9TREE|nr:hypothetical protein I302_02970 [Kwoniella bestiolae CBS 10118]OCF28119.1 hypothetical protein I302_02970 [Kwoniella bestiolae CBS 10118]